MENTVTCYKCIYNECPYYQKEYRGRLKIQGGPFWLEYTGEERCGIYRCCVEGKELPHRGRCGELPRSRCDQQDPVRTSEEDAAGLKKMLEVLRSLD